MLQRYKVVGLVIGLMQSVITLSAEVATSVQARRVTTARGPGAAWQAAAKITDPRAGQHLPHAPTALLTAAMVRSIRNPQTGQVAEHHPTPSLVEQARTLRTAVKCKYCSPCCFQFLLKCCCCCCCCSSAKVVAQDSETPSRDSDEYKEPRIPGAGSVTQSPSNVSSSSSAVYRVGSVPHDQRTSSLLPIPETDQVLTISVPASVGALT